MKSPGFLAMLAIASMLLITGCNSQQGSTTHTYGSVGWSSESEQSVPGINQAMLNWYIVDGDLVYVVWTDLPGGAGTSSGSSGSGTQTRESHVTTVELSDGRQFAFEYKLDRNTPQATGQLNIEDLTFDTRVGGLLMVSTTAETTEVRQAEIPQKLASSLTKEGQTRESLEVELQELAQAENPFKFYFENK